MTPITPPDLPVVGGYYMQRGSLVMVASELSPGRFETAYIQILGDGEVTGGGGSFAWPASDYTPITDPYLLAASKAHQAMLDVERLKREVATAVAAKTTWLAAMRAIRDAAKATGSTT